MLYDPKWKAPEVKPAVKPWQKLLLDAADLIEEKGWVQGDFETENGFCTLGAMRTIMDAHGLYQAYVEATERLAKHIRGPHGPQRGDSLCAIALWNDDINVRSPDARNARTKENVLTTLRAAAGETP